MIKKCMVHRFKLFGINFQRTATTWTLYRTNVIVLLRPENDSLCGTWFYATGLIVRFAYCVNFVINSHAKCDTLCPQFLCDTPFENFALNWPTSAEWVLAAFFMEPIFCSGIPLPEKFAFLRWRWYFRAWVSATGRHNFLCCSFCFSTT